MWVARPRGPSNRPFCDGHHSRRRRTSAILDPGRASFLKNVPARQGVVMIEALALALVAIALGVPAVIVATMLGSKFAF